VIATAKDEQALLGVGLYAPAEASRLLQIPETTLARWVKGYTYALRSGARRRGHPVVKRSEALARTLTFVDLAELLMVKGFRVAGVSLDRIRVAAETAADLFQTTHPLAIESLRTDGRDVFARVQETHGYEGLVSVSERGQHVFPNVVEQYLNDLDFDRGNLLANRWWPHGRSGGVVVDPRIVFGAPHVEGAGVPTRALAELVHAGEPDERVAELYDLDAHRVRLAVEFEDELAAA